MALSPSSVISGAQGTGTFANPTAAMGGVGSMMKSPASGKADKMTETGKSLDITGPNGISEDIVRTTYPGTQGDEIWDTLQEVQGVSDGFTNCGSFMKDALIAATQDFIRNSGIQQAGRELASLLGEADDAIACAAGFATLLESEEVLDEETGVGDAPALHKRTKGVIEDVTNAQSVGQILNDCDAIRGLTAEFDGMCAAIMGRVNDLIGKDLATIAAVLNKLAQWAAFAKLATSDPCALVNSNRMLEHVTTPVLQDIMKLYASATGQTEVPEEPENPLGEELGKPPGTVVDLPKHRQQPQAGQATPEQISSTLPVGAEVVAKNNEASPKGGYDSTADEWVVDEDTGEGGWVSADDPDFPTEDNNGNPIEKKSDFSKGLEKGETPIDNRNEKFADNVKAVEYKAVAEDKNKVAKVHKVGWCTGATEKNVKTKDQCDMDATGEWHVQELTDNEVQVAGSVEAAAPHATPIKTIADTKPKYEEGIPPSSPSSASKAPKITAKKSRDTKGVNIGSGTSTVTKERTALEGTGSYYGTWGYPNKTSPLSPAETDPILSKIGYAPDASSADPYDPKPFDVATVQVSSGLGILPGTYRISAGAASLPLDTSLQKSNIGGDISEYDRSREVAELAMKTGDWSAVETCACQPTEAVANAKEVGACDFTGLKFPDGYQIVPSSNYTEKLIAKVDAAEASGSGEYVVGDDGNIYQSAEVVVMAKYGATLVSPFEPGKATCQKHSGKWYVITSAIKGTTGGSLAADITNAGSKAVCEDANGVWVCKKGQAGSTNAKKQIQSYGKFTNKKNMNTKSKLPTAKAFDTDKLPSLNFSAIT
jgi:hypothetical protein